MTFTQIALAIAGMVIWAGLYYGDPVSTWKSGLVTIGIVVVAAFVLTLLR